MRSQGTQGYLAASHCPLVRPATLPPILFRRLVKVSEMLQPGWGLQMDGSIETREERKGIMKGCTKYTVCFVLRELLRVHMLRKQVRAWRLDLKQV